MKKHLAFLLFCLICFQAHFLRGQSIPNSGFESWTTVSGIEMPVDWTGGSLTLKSTDSRTGSYSLNLKPTNDSTTWEIAEARTVFAFTDRPQLLTGYYKATLDVPGNSDSMRIGVYLYKKNGTAYESIGYGYVDTLPPVNSYSHFSIPIQYSSSANPDTAIITLVGYMESGNKGSREAFFDDLSFSGTAGLLPGKLAAKLSMYPNPASQSLTVEASSLSRGAVDLFIRDMLGRVVQRTHLFSTGDVQQTLDVSQLNAGIYTFELRTAEHHFVERFLIQR